MAAKKKLTKAPCGHPIASTCGSCTACQICVSKNATDVVVARAQVGQLTTAIGQGAVREEQLKQYISSAHYRPQERNERDLSIARIALLRRRLEIALGGNGVASDGVPAEIALRVAIDEALKMDDLTRTRPIEEVVMEATSLSKPPPSPKEES